MYKYDEQKDEIFTESGQVMFLNIRDNIQKLLKLSGVVTLEKAIGNCGGDSWTMLACVDRLVELGEIREVEQGGKYMNQHRIFKDN